MSQAKARSLNELKDNIVPEVSYDLAPGIVLILTLIVIISCYLLIFIYKQYQKNAYRRDALEELKNIKNQWHKNKDPKLLRKISYLLKVSAYELAPQTSSLTGQDWLTFLKTSCVGINSDSFSILNEITYRNDSYSLDLGDDKITQLFEDTKKWITQHVKPGSKNA